MAQRTTKRSTSSNRGSRARKSASGVKTTTNAQKKALAAKRKAQTTAQKKSIAANRKAQWKTFKDLQKQIKLAWRKTQSDVKKNANVHTIISDKNHLLLLLGEANYMARECMRMSGKRKRRS